MMCPGRIVYLVFLLTCIEGTELLHRNLVYSSPFVEHPQFGHDIKAIHARQVMHARRQLGIGDASSFKDEHYPTFYGADFSNSPFVWTGGVNFTHSVASGDPLDTSVLLWTRAVPVSPPGKTLLPDQSVPVCISYKISTSATLDRDPVDSGTVFTSYDVDFTVKMEAQGLEPDTTYYYQFFDCANPSIKSPVGKTRTFASPNTPPQRVNHGKPLTIAVFSCSQFQAGWFNAYGFAAHNTSADLFVHLGDYIYETPGNGAPIGRMVLGGELATIHDYRQRFNQYRTDESLLFAHKNAPWITVWTITRNQIADNAWKAGTADSNDTEAGCSFSASGACYTDRKFAGARAYHEWMPIRQVAVDDQFRIWRNVQIGKLLDLTMLDTRNYNRDITDLYYNNVVQTLANVENRSLMGAKQEKWLYDTLTESRSRGAIWRVIGQQIVFTQLNQSNGFNVDAWDGYRANRRRVLDHLYNNKIGNTVILAGDSHANWVSDLARPNDTTTYNPKSGEGAIGVEFAGTAVSSGSTFGSNITPEAADAISRVLADVNEDLQWSEGSYRGFFTLTIGPNTLVASYYAMNNTKNANLDGFMSAQFVVKNGENRLNRPVAGGVVKAGVLKSSIIRG